MNILISSTGEARDIAKLAMHQHSGDHGRKAKGNSWRGSSILCLISFLGDFEAADVGIASPCLSASERQKRGPLCEKNGCLLRQEFRKVLSRSDTSRSSPIRDQRETVGVKTHAL